jgi:hypothetical protein
MKRGQRPPDANGNRGAVTIHRSRLTGDELVQPTTDWLCEEAQPIEIVSGGS